MAKKTRTPAPPRRVQAPQRRDTVRAPAATDQRQRLILIGFAVSGVVAVAAVIAVIVLLTGGGGGGNGDLAATMRTAGFTLQTFKDQGRKHTSNINAKIKYNSFPPTSGEHYFQPAIWDLYSDPVPQVQLVHNLEHGGIVIQYGSDVPKATIDQIDAFYREDATALLVAPLSALKNKIALTAWTHLATGTRFDEKAFSAFRDAYRFKGPEKFPPEALQPGT